MFAHWLNRLFLLARTWGGTSGVFRESTSVIAFRFPLESMAVAFGDAEASEEGPSEEDPALLRAPSKSFATSSLWDGTTKTSTKCCPNASQHRGARARMRAPCSAGRGRGRSGLGGSHKGGKVNEPALDGLSGRGEEIQACFVSQWQHDNMMERLNQSYRIDTMFKQSCWKCKPRCM